MLDPRGERRTDDEPNPVQFNPPQFNRGQLQEVYRAAAAYAAKERSDPFAFGRMLTHLKRGIANINEVISDSRPTP